VPKLNDEVAAKVAGAANPMGLVDDGIYLARLDEDVTVKAATNSDMWLWPFVLVPTEGVPFGNKKVTHRTWTSEASFWRLKETFDAFGVSTSTDTNDLVGKTVRLHMTQKEDYKGELDDETGLVKLVNDVKAILPADGPTGVDEAAKVRRAKAREAAKQALLDDPTVADGGSSDDPLF
jgi:hypothetical protein